jgi:hypothetical protein
MPFLIKPPLTRGAQAPHFPAFPCHKPAGAAFGKVKAVAQPAFPTGSDFPNVPRRLRCRFTINTTRPSVVPFFGTTDGLVVLPPAAWHGAA